MHQGFTASIPEGFNLNYTVGRRTEKGSLQYECRERNLTFGQSVFRFDGCSARCSKGSARDVRKEIARLTRKLAKEYCGLFTSDPNFRKRAGQFLRALLLRALLPPRPRRRGRPGNPNVTKAIRLLRKFRRELPNERGQKIWKRIYPLAIPNYTDMSEVEQNDARQQLRQRVRWRQRAGARGSRSQKLVAVRTRPGP
jgi:hypothetical protein